MSDFGNDMNQPILNLSAEEKRIFSYLFNQADTDQLGVVTGERAVSFFERTKVSPNVLGEIWQIADTENRGLLTKPGFCIVLRLIGHYQAGSVPSMELAFKSGPLPKFDGLVIPGVPAQVPAMPSPTTGQAPPGALQPQLSGQAPIRVPPLDSQKVQQYSGLFERSGAQGGMLDGATAKSIFDRAGLPNDALGRIWNLSDREQRGALDQTEFIIAMHLLTSMKTRAMTALPSTLPPGLYEAAARKGAPPPPNSRGSTGPGAIPRQFSGGQPPRTQSPLARTQAYAAPQPLPAQTTGPPWLVTVPEKAKYDQFFGSIDASGRGVITGEQAVRFFSDSRLSEDTLASIWDLADINSEGQLNRDQFAVAMYLIRQQRGPNPAPLPAFLPPALVPPSMRSQQQQTQSTAPAFDNANNTSQMSKSATEDLFGLDDPRPSQAFQAQPPGFQSPQTTGLQAQTTGASSARDPFATSQPASPSSPQRLKSQPQSASTMFKPFMPTSAFGTSIVSQNTGGSMTSSQGQARGPPQQPPSNLQKASAMDDLLGDDEAHAAETSKLNNDTTELANMSNQIGNLRSQMEQTQTKKAATQQDLNATSTQKRDLELRLQQFRSQYESEVRAVKELDQRLATSRDSTKKLGQELATLEGLYQDLQTQHYTVEQTLQADQQESTSLKQRIAQINAEVTSLKPEVERLKLDARQQKGLVSINKKQLATNESERDRVQDEKTELEREAAEREGQARSAPAEAPVPQEQQPDHSGRDVGIAGAVGAAAVGAFEFTKRLGGGSNDTASPGAATGASTMSSTNPFFRKASGDAAPAERSVSSPQEFGTNHSAFDALFGPSAAHTPSGATGNGTPPATSFGSRSIPAPPSASAATAQQQGPAAGMTDSIQSFSSVGEPTPSATPPLSDPAKESPLIAEAPPPPPPENRQFMPSQLPVGGLIQRNRRDSGASSTQVIPPASRAGGVVTPPQLAESTVAAEERRRSVPGAFESVEPAQQQAEEAVPGAFPAEEPQPTTAAREISSHHGSEAQLPSVEPTKRDDFDSAFDGFGHGEKAKELPQHEEDPFAPSSSAVQPPSAAVVASEFPPIRSLEPEDDEDFSDEEPEHAFGDSFTHAPTHANAVTNALEHSTREAAPPPHAPTVASGDDIAHARPNMTSMESTASDLPALTAQSSPPSYEVSSLPSHGGGGERSASNHFPPEFGGLLPAREVPTNNLPPQSNDLPITSMPVERSIAQPEPRALQPTSRTSTGQSLYPAVQTPATDPYYDASSRPISSLTDGSPAQHAEGSRAPPPLPPKNAFDDFDDFDDLSEAKEADKNAGQDFEFGFGHHSAENEFNPAFDSPAASMTNTMTSSQQTPVPTTKSLADSSNGFASWQAGNHGSPEDLRASGASSSSIQHTPQNVQHDWDSIFSGLDNSKHVDTSLGKGVEQDPWGAPASGTAATNGESLDRTPTATMAPLNGKAPAVARAITPGTEHDDPILKRLTGMGYQRAEALGALEMYDYDINKAVDHLTSR